MKNLKIPKVTVRGFQKFCTTIGSVWFGKLTGFSEDDIFVKNNQKTRKFLDEANKNTVDGARTKKRGKGKKKGKN